MKLILATDNKNKLREFREILAGFNVELVGKTESGMTAEIEETGTSFEENAFIKADAVMRATGCAAVADDSGLCVDALDGAPGIYSARFTGTHDATDAERRAFLLRKMEGITDRTAHFVSAICCVFPDGETIRTRGELHGSILTEERGTGGFGYDALFLPDGETRSNAELSPEEKNAISHRGKAMREFRRKWEKRYADR